MTGSAAVESSPQDDRIYVPYTVASNKLQCLLISDPTTDKASAAMDVRVGHLSDPDDTPGLAHFLEHMLFMGTDKYPDENSYNVYLSTHGGSSNAFTDTESTNYFFDVSYPHFEGAVDRFAQFFISPLFAPSSTEKEMNAVDSEHAKNLQSDFWRMFQLTKSLCRPDHPFSKFGSGSLETLKRDNIRHVLLDFHAQYYSANVMKLVLLGRESIDELQAIVDKYFCNIKNIDISVPVFPGKPYDQLAKLLHVVPVKREMRSMEMTFPMREIDSLYLQKPTRYISHLIGHEGTGSLLALLKQKGLANELSAGESRTCSDWSSFTISIELTDSGLDQVENISEIVFAYLAFLKEKGPQEWIHEETSTVAACSFRFLSKKNPIDYTSSLAGAMQLYPPEHILSGPYKIYEYDPILIEECMSYLTPSNMLLAVTSKQFEGSTSSKERWYGTDYDLSDIREEILDRWEKATVSSDLVDGMLHFPEKNEMIATDFNLKNAAVDMPLDEPRLLLDTDRCRLWYKPDNVFQMPKVNVMAQLRTRAASESPESSVLAMLWSQLLQEHANGFTYLASMASLHCSFTNTPQGIELTVSGYNHKASVLMSRIIETIVDLPDALEIELFERIKDKVFKQYQNFLFAHPYQHAFYGGDLCLEETKWSMEDKMAALADITMANVAGYSHQLLSRFHLEMLVHGNASPEEAEEMANIILNGLKPLAPLKSSLPHFRVVQLEKKQEYLYRFPEFNEGNTNSCIQNIYQIGPIDLTTHAVLLFLHHLMKEPAFNKLRTVEQLGYLVHTSVKTSGDDIKSLLFLIQSDSFDPVYMDQRIEAFLDSFRAQIVAMSPDEFQANIDAVVKNLWEKNKNLGEESSKYWSVITNNTYLFKKNQILGAKVEDITMEQVLRFFDKYVSCDAPHRRKLCVQVFSKPHMESFETPVSDGVNLIRDVVDFRGSMSLFPLPKRVDVENMKMT